MPNTKSALKRLRIEEKRRVRNHAVKSKVRTFVKKAREAIDAQPAAAETTETLRQAISQLDRAVTKGVIHKNNAARRKSRLVMRLRALQPDDATDEA